MNTPQSVNFLGTFTMWIENGKPHRLEMEDALLEFLNIPATLTPEETFKAWAARISPQEQAIIAKAVKGSISGLKSEVKYHWNHDRYGMLCANSVGIRSSQENGVVTLKGFFHATNEAVINMGSPELEILRMLLTEAIMDSFVVCGLADISTNKIFILKDVYSLGSILPKGYTYDQWRDAVSKLVFMDDADRFRENSNRLTLLDWLDSSHRERQGEYRCLIPKMKQYRWMRLHFVRLDKPIAGRYHEFFTFSDTNESHRSDFKEALRKRLIDGLALPYRELDLINLKTGVMYSSKSEPGDYSEQFDECGSFDDVFTNFISRCECTDEEKQDIANKFYVKNMCSSFEGNQKLIEKEILSRNSKTNIPEWVRLQAFLSARDERSSPYMAIFTVQVITEEKEQELQAKQMLEHTLRAEMQYKQAILSTAIAVYRFNVTRDILYDEVIEQDGINPLLPAIGLKPPCSYNEYINRKADFLTVKEEANIFRKTFNSSVLLDMFKSKRRANDIEYEFMLNGKKGVFRESVILTEDIETNEIWGIIYVRNCTHEREESHRVEQAIRDAFYQAQRANSAKTLFMSQMSHDIRTPLNSILGMATIAQEHIDDRERVLDCMSKIEYAGRHLLEIINNVLDLSAIESGKTELAKVPFDLGAFLDETMKMIKPMIDRRNHKLIINRSEIHTSVVGDPAKLRQVLMNVIGNAIKYTPDGGTITFTGEELERERHELCRYRFTVEDTGIGMAKEFIPRIFDPFVRADNLRTTRVEGTGLGMPIAQNIARMMNGGIKVKSTEGSGSVFEITICLKRGDDHTQKYIGEISMEEAPKEHLSDYDFGRRILLAEDLEFNAEIAAEFLGQAGITVEVAENGALALNRFKASKAGYYDLIFMDIQMPELDGYQTTRAIRALDRPDARTIPIVAMTANAFLEDVQKAKESGMNGHIAKPLNVQELIEQLKKHFGDCKRKTIQ